MTANRNEFVINITRDQDEEKNGKNRQLQLFYIIKELYTTEKLLRDNMKAFYQEFNDENISSFDPKTQIKIKKLLAPFQHLANMELIGFNELKKFTESKDGKVAFNPDCLSFINQKNNWEYLSEASINNDLFLDLINSTALSENDKFLFKKVAAKLTTLGKGAGINSFLIQPVQRAPRYSLLLAQAEKNAEQPEFKEILNKYVHNIKKETNQIQLDIATVKDTKKLLPLLNAGKTREIKKELKNIGKAIATTMQLDAKKKEDKKKIKKYVYEIYNIAMEQRQLGFDRRSKKLKKIEKNIFSSLKKVEKQEVKERVNPVSPKDFFYGHERILETHKELPKIVDKNTKPNPLTAMLKMKISK